MRILFSSWPGYGHLIPMVPLVRAAQRVGHEVVVSSGPDLTPVAAGLGVVTVPAGPTAAAAYARLPRHEPIGQMPPQERTAFAGKHLFGAAGAERARDLAAFTWRWQPDLVVHDTFELGAAAVAIDAGTPHVTHGYGPMHIENDEMIAHIGTALADVGGTDPATAVFAAPYLDICPAGMRARDPNQWRDVRPLRPSPGEPGDDAVAARIAALPYPDTVYVTLGTVMNQAAGVFRAVLEASNEIGVNVVVTTGPDLDPAALGPLLPSVLAFSYLPQADVLPHCSAVVSHAGAGTMLGALCYGLPQLCLPQGAGQPLNAAAIATTGAALALQPHETTTAGVAEALHRLLREPPFRVASTRLRNQIDEMPGADETLTELAASAEDVGVEDVAHVLAADRAT